MRNPTDTLKRWAIELESNNAGWYVVTADLEKYVQIASWSSMALKFTTTDGVPVARKICGDYAAGIAAEAEDKIATIDPRPSWYPVAGTKVVSIAPAELAHRLMVRAADFMEREELEQLRGQAERFADYNQARRGGEHSGPCHARILASFLASYLA